MFVHLLCHVQMVSAPGERRMSLDLKPRLNYTLQVRRSGLAGPPLWSDWSEPHHIYLDSKNHLASADSRYSLHAYMILIQGF